MLGHPGLEKEVAPHSRVRWSGKGPGIELKNSYDSFTQEKLNLKHSSKFLKVPK